MSICCVMGNEMNPVRAEESSKKLVVKAENGLNGSIEMEISITASWDNHYNADVTLKNKLDEKIDNWMVAFDFNNNIENIWNAKIISHEKNHYVVKNADWNQDIPVGGQITFGMTVSYEEEVSNLTNYYDATDLVEVEREYDITYTEFAQWDDKINGQITIQNNSEEDIEDWRLEFLSDVDFDNVWNAELLECADGYSYLENMSYNQNIPAGGSVSFGFIATCEKTPDFSEHILYEIGEVQKDSADGDEEEYYDGDVIWGEEDFESTEDYQEYLRSIGGYAPYSFRNDRIMTFNLEKGKELYCELECQIDAMPDTYAINESQNSIVLELKGRAFQNFCLTDNYLYATQHAGKDTYLLRFKRNKVKGEKAAFKDAMLLKGFGHGQSLQKFTEGNSSYFLLTCRPFSIATEKVPKGLKITDWGTEIACIQYKGNTIINYENDKGEKFGLMKNLEYATNKVDMKTNKRKSFGTIVRVDLGLYSNKTLILWKRKANMEVQIVTYDFKEMKKRLSIEHKIIDFSNVNINTNAYTCFKGRKFVSPNGSMQGIDIYGSDIYISSGDQCKSMKLCLSRLKVSKKKIIGMKDEIKIKEIAEIAAGSKMSMEVEGVQITKKKVFVCFTPCNQNDGRKLPQYVMSIDR